ncbi:MAG: RsmB/NOP family class I SAM-dependent RNA methyltransferase [Roseovarius sp.]|uniref:RsmB/NOP family class I SAM-dependent RNA methyltransferase n=1 Tax=Roseovarius sp. TaxID=1486281 RepID=UPI0032EB740E
MTPGARVAAAIYVLDAVRAGEAAEKALTGWARGARYAGSKDRGAVRDHVFNVLRRWRSCAALGGGQDGRRLMIGALRHEGVDLETLFSGEGHAPSILTEVELSAGEVPSGLDALDVPDWLWPHFETSLGASAEGAAEVLRHRAPVMLRVNSRRGTVADAQAQLASEGIDTTTADIAKTALQVISGERKIAGSVAYADGLVELQDGSSQAAMEALEVTKGARVLDYCAGGGGKVLALAARAEATWYAHDIAPQRMNDLPARAKRAGVDVTRLETGAIARTAPFDLVLCDAPCSGSGTWRRSPDAKWRLTQERLDALTETQYGILAEAAPLVASGGCLAYATCSVFKVENEAVVARFLQEHPSWRLAQQRTWPISEAGDGFCLAQLVHG